MTKILINSGDFVIEGIFFHIIVFLKSVMTSPQIRTVIKFYAKTLKHFPEKYSCLYFEFGFYC